MAGFCPSNLGLTPFFPQGSMPLVNERTTCLCLFRMQICPAASSGPCLLRTNVSSYYLATNNDPEKHCNVLDPAVSLSANSLKLVYAARPKDLISEAQGRLPSCVTQDPGVENGESAPLGWARALI